MTREERYKFIATQIHFADWFMHFHLNFDEELHQALKEAEEIINDLSVVPNEEKGTDLIRREEVLKQQYRIDDSATLSARDVVNVEDIEDVPSVKPITEREKETPEGEYINKAELIKRMLVHINRFAKEKNFSMNEGLKYAQGVIVGMPTFSVPGREKETDTEYIKHTLSELAQYNADMLKAFNAGKELAEREKGEWIEKEVSLDGDIAYECSKCGELFCLIDGTPADNLYNFCPNCGADLRVEPHEEDKHTCSNCQHRNPVSNNEYRCFMRASLLTHSGSDTCKLWE